VFPLASKKGYRYDPRLNFAMFFVTRRKVCFIIPQHLFDG
jgi:hypothetical protein